MKRIFFCLLVAVVMVGCVSTWEYRETTVRKDENGNIIGSDYIERLEQFDYVPWVPGFGHYLYNN